MYCNDAGCPSPGLHIHSSQPRAPQDQYETLIRRWGFGETAAAQITEQATVKPSRLACSECGAELFAVQVDGDTGEVVCGICETVATRLSFTVAPRV